jgi:hypothetical protein
MQVASTPVASAAGGSRARRRRADLAACALLAGLWMLAALATGPVGDFPLNDSWAYGLPVRALVETGELRLTDWQSMPLVAQLLWGALFCLPAGFSFTALRVSTLVLGGGAVLALYALLRRCGAAPALAGLGAASLAANPIFMALAHTFMTDVPFLAWALLGVLFLVRGVDEGRRGLFAAGIGFVIAATLTRQLGLGIALAFAAAAPLRERLGARSLARACLPLLLCAVALVAWEAQLGALGQLPALYGAKLAELMDALGALAHGRVAALRHPLERAGWLALYAGAGVLPLAAALAAPSLCRARRRSALCALAAAATASVLVSVGAGIPALGNVWIDFGIGPRTLPGPALPGLPRGVWWGVNATALLAAAIAAVHAARALARVWARARAREPLGDAWRPAFLALLALVGFAPVALTDGVAFDRYFAALVPWVLALVIEGARQRRAPRRRALGVGYALAAAGLALGVAATHDYVAWNRARWEAGAWLLARPGVVRQDVDGGFEWNNYLSLAQALEWRHRAAPVVDRSAARHALVLAAAPGDEVLAAFPARAWLPRAARVVLAVRRAPAASRERAPGAPR